MYKIQTVCRSCDYGKPTASGSGKSVPSGEKLIEVFDLGYQPPANDFVLPDGEHQGHAPLKVLFCPRCTLSQLSVVVKPEILYANYPYITSRSQTMLNHFMLLWETIQAESPAQLVVEIGSNDGWFLKFCKNRGAQSVLGIDPAENLKPADDSGIISVCGLFDATSASIAHTAMPIVDVIVARHVFAHLDNWHEFIKNLDILADQNTLILIECPYVVDLLKGVEFDTCYHEHLSYVSIKAVQALLEHTPFKLHKIVNFSIHGGAIGMMLRRNDCGISPDPSVRQYLSREKLTTDDWALFAAAVQQRISKLKNMVTGEVAVRHKRICGFGASAKSTVWINACGFTRKEIAFICDNTPQKQGRFSPGTDIPIVDEGALLRELPDYAVMFCWNFEREVLEKQKRYLELGGKFIIPVPEIRIVP